MFDIGSNGLSTGDKLCSYPKIWNLGHKEVVDIFADPVEVQEKVDGSQFSFGMIDDVLMLRSKGVVIYQDNVPKLFQASVDTVLAVQEKLPENVVFRGEAFQGPHHNHLSYGRVPQGNIMLFDVMIAYSDYAPHSVVMEWAEKLGIEAIPSYGTHIIASIEEVENFLQRESVLGNCLVEGVVMKNYIRFGVDSKPLMVKLVRADFREAQSASWAGAHIGSKGIIEVLGNRYCTEARWRKAVQHLQDDGILENAPRDIGKLMAAVPDDVLEEEKDAIMAALFKWAWPSLKRMTTRGLPEWYKDRLAKMQFEGDSDGDSD